MYGAFGHQSSPLVSVRLHAVPYVSSSTGALYEAIRSPDPVVLLDQPPISPQLTALLSRMLDKDPATRIQLAEVSQLTTCRNSMRQQAVRVGLSG
jgi:hypothetical protein